MMPLAEKHLLVECARHIEEAAALVRAGLMTQAAYGLGFPDPSHPRVVAWRAYRPPSADIRDRAFALIEASQMAAEARETGRSPEIVERAKVFACSIADMPIADVRRYLDFVGLDRRGRA